MTAERGTMPMEDVLKLRSGDHEGLMGDFPASPRWPEGEWHWCDDDYEMVDYIAASMGKDGWDGPPVCIQFEPPKYWSAVEKTGWKTSLVNGHHRVIAAYMAGLTEVPWTTDWSESDDF